MLTANLDVQNGWCNGTLGTIHSVTDKTIIMKNNKDELMPIPRKTYLRTKPRVECDVLVQKGKKRQCGRTDCEHTPVYMYVDDDDSMSSPLQLTVEQFPLLLAWGLTIHKSQGMSLDSCAITLPYQYSPSLLYVALSRCTSFETLSLRSESPIRFDQIRPAEDVMRHIFGWEERTCKLCDELYMGPYSSFCQDCCSAPGKYSEYRFIDFIKEANPSPDMLQYMNYAIHNPDKTTTKRWKKFVSFLKKQSKK
jgi:hypothetical protein